MGVGAGSPSYEQSPTRGSRACRKILIEMSHPPHLCTRQSTGSAGAPAGWGHSLREVEGTRPDLEVASPLQWRLPVTRHVGLLLGGGGSSWLALPRSDRIPLHSCFRTQRLRRLGPAEEQGFLKSAKGSPTWAFGALGSILCFMG